MTGLECQLLGRVALAWFWTGIVVAPPGRGDREADLFRPGLGSVLMDALETVAIGELHLKLSWLPRWWQRAILWCKRVAEDMGADVGWWRPAPGVRSGEHVVIEITMGVTRMLVLHVAPDVAIHVFPLPAQMLVPAERLLAFGVFNWSRERFRVDIVAAGRRTEAPLCGELVAFVDGELGTRRAQQFRAHLLTCSECRAGLVEALQLDARLSDSAERKGGQHV